jgi:hypothetical protein
MTLQQTVLEASRQADRENPARLQTNRNVDCYQHTARVVDILRAQGIAASFVGKTAGEGQYVPPTGFPREVVHAGTAKTYTCTGVSHDAIWVGTDRQFDLVGGGNDGSEPLGSPGVPTANEIPAQYHRPNNPPLYPITGAPVPPLPPPPPAPKPYPGDSYFVSAIGVPLEADYALAGQRLDAGSATWFARTIWRHVNEGMTMDASVAQSRKEWRAALGLPPL